nr:asparagine synthase-related protein [Fodinicola feengrottensis]
MADVPICSLISGGLDSSGLTALVAKVLKARGAGPVRTFTVDYRGLAENFQPDEVRTTLDAPYVADLVQHLGAEHTNVMVSTEDLLDPVMRAATIRARDVPSPLGDMQTGLYLLYREAAIHSRVALTGQLADSLFVASNGCRTRSSPTPTPSPGWRWPRSVPAPTASATACCIRRCGLGWTFPATAPKDSTRHSPRCRPSPVRTS